MAKKTAYESFRDQIPLRKEFQLPMVADSTTEIGVEIDTGLAPGTKRGWIIRGVEWTIELIASPHTRRTFLEAADDSAVVLQLCRGELPATVSALLEYKDNDLILEDNPSIVHGTNVAEDIQDWPRRKACTAVTQLANLHVLFATSVDVPLISDATYHISGAVLYHLVDAPTIRPAEE